MRSVASTVVVLLALVAVSSAVDTLKHRKRYASQAGKNDLVEAEVVGQDQSFQKQPLVQSKKSLGRDVNALKTAGVVMLPGELYTKLVNTAVGGQINPAIMDLLTVRRPMNLVLLETEKAKKQAGSGGSKCVWVMNESGGNDPLDRKVMSPQRDCWNTSIMGIARTKQCSEVSGVSGPGPFTNLLVQRYGENFGCWDKQQTLNPGFQRAIRKDEISFVCYDVSGRRIATPQRCTAKIYIGAAYFGEARVRARAGDMCLMGARTMNAYANSETRWTVNNRVLFNTVGVAQAGPDAKKKPYNRILLPKSGGSFLGPVAANIVDNFADTYSPCFATASGEFTESVSSTLEAASGAFMSADGNAFGSAQAQTLGWGLWYVLETKGVAHADCLGAPSTVHNYFLSGTEKVEELQNTLNRFLRGREVQDTNVLR